MSIAKTKFVIAISQKLSAAPDSDAKVDLIDELSENLYGRYQDMVAAGMPEDEAYASALDKLGDVNELLAYLDCCDTPKDAAGQDSGAWTDAADNWFQGIGSFVRKTISQAQESINDAAAMVQDAADQIQNSDSFEINAGGETIHINMGGKRAPVRTGDDEELEFSSDGLREIKVNIIGDLTVYLDGDPDSSIRLSGDIEDLRVVSGEDGVLTITQGKSASGSFLFSRALSSASIELTIPQRPWDQLDISTVSGDVEIQDGVLEANTVCLKTVSGDMELDSLNVSQRLEVKTTSGDLELSDSTCAELVFHSASGSMDAEDLTAAVLAETASGDVSITGYIRALRADTASGDVELNTQVFPEALELSTKSGSCSVAIPQNPGFVLRFSTVSSSLNSDFPLTTDVSARQGWGRRSGEAYYQNGGDGRVFVISSISGDIELREN